MKAHKHRRSRNTRDSRMKNDNENSNISITSNTSITSSVHNCHAVDRPLLSPSTKVVVIVIIVSLLDDLATFPSPSARIPARESPNAQKSAAWPVPQRHNLFLLESQHKILVFVTTNPSEIAALLGGLSSIAITVRALCGPLHQFKLALAHGKLKLITNRYRAEKDIDNATYFIYTTNSFYFYAAALPYLFPLVDDLIHGHPRHRSYSYCCTVKLFHVTTTP